MSVSLSIDEKPGALHVFAALDIVSLIMVLAFVGTTMVHRAGIQVEMAGSAARFPAAEDSAVLTVRGAAKTVLYLGSRRIDERELRPALQKLRDEQGIEMILLRSDPRLPATEQLRLSNLVLGEGLQCGLLAEPLPAVPGS